MRKLLLILSIATVGLLQAQNQKKDWFVTAGGTLPFSFHSPKYQAYLQTGYFLTNRFAMGVEYQHAQYGHFFQKDALNLFARYYFLNREQVGLYGFSSVGIARMNYDTYYYKDKFNQLNLDFGIGSSVLLKNNWRLNIELSLVRGNSLGSQGRVGLSYTIPYRKAGVKKGIL